MNGFEMRRQTTKRDEENEIESRDGRGCGYGDVDVDGRAGEIQSVRNDLGGYPRFLTSHRVNLGRMPSCRDCGIELGGGYGFEVHHAISPERVQARDACLPGGFSEVHQR